MFEFFIKDGKITLLDVSLDHFPHLCSSPMVNSGNNVSRESFMTFRSCLSLVIGVT